MILSETKRDFTTRNYLFIEINTWFIDRHGVTSFLLDEILSYLIIFSINNKIVVHSYQVQNIGFILIIDNIMEKKTPFLTEKISTNCIINLNERKWFWLCLWYKLWEKMSRNFSQIKKYYILKTYFGFYAYIYALHI